MKPGLEPRSTDPGSFVVDTATRSGPTVFQAVIGMVAIVAIAIGVRLLGSHWLVGAGIAPDFSFHPDDDRFVSAAKSFRDYPSLGGYVLGMVSQLFLVLTGTRMLGMDVNALVALRGITVFHAALTVVATYALAMFWLRDRTQALLAALFLALCPLHVINSNFGTADVTAVCLFYLAVLCGTKYLQTTRDFWFTLMAALCGFALAVKFFIPLLAVPAVLVFTEKGDRRWSMALSSAFVLAGAFAIASLFNYTPWDFRALLRMLMFDNVSIVAGKGPLENILLYSWRFLAAPGLPLGLLAVVGAIAWAVRTIAAARSLRWAPDPARFIAALRTPAALLLLPLALHGVMIVIAGVSFTRHLLIYMPVLCVLAAATLMQALRKLQIGGYGQAAICGGLVAYLLWNAWGLQALYRNDIRVDMADWVEARVAEGHRVHAASFYTPVRGTLYDRNQDLASLPDGDFLVTCDLEFERYLEEADAKRIFHAKGGQGRVDFYRDVFLGESRFHVAAVFRQRLVTPEQRLIAAGWLPPIETFTPSLCLAFGTASTLPESVEQAVLQEATRDTPKI